MSTLPPFIAAQPATSNRRGFFWIPGDLVETDAGTRQRGAMYVEWLAGAEVTKPVPLILIHGGGGQGTDWLGTPDGRPGWAQRFVDEGYLVYVVDRPGFGRSPYDEELLGRSQPSMSSETASFLFAPHDAEDEHSQWPWGLTPGSRELEQLVAGQSFLFSDREFSQDLDARRLVELLDTTGRAVLITHSAGAPAGWLALNRRPDSVAGIVSVEPMAPPFADIPGNELEWGLTSAPVVTDQAGSDAAQQQSQLQAGDAKIAGFAGTAMLLLAGDASGFGRGTQAPTAEFLSAQGAHVEALNLADRGIEGNGHGLILEKNSDETIAPVLDWLDSTL